ncbi:hypothetical protein FTO74_11225 [Granulicella sp. WH15]|uniref:hypothetical protein n=1 Tax=Granulicella sp. WH15 TaxID=2602070 RepID=UPI001367413D|nr:hypothetical protein [Granulicella sp. WH15]QHN03880.1 hypothetical protein FTO74_11225 [Granulicella sp. WH15]
MATSQASREVRGTQSFVRTLTLCWQHPSLTGLEIAWRWIFGAPALALVLVKVQRVLVRYTGDGFDLTRLGLDRKLMGDPVGALTADPMGVVSRFTAAAGVVLPDLLHIAAWLAPLLVAVWIVVSSLGRTLVLRRADPALKGRPATLMVLQTIRMVALVASFGLWFWCLRTAARVCVEGPIAAAQEPNLVGYCALVIISSLVLFVLWGAVSWAFSMAPLLAMKRGLGVAGALKAATELGPVKGKLVEINLVMGIVKIALIVLAMVFSACPLPFESVTTPEFLFWWWVGAGVFYVVASDFFHVARLVAYLELWRVYEV